jgi:hypothetical protein
MGKWDKEGVDPVRQAELAREAREKGLPEYVVEASKAVPDHLVRSIVDDFRKGPSSPSSIAAKPATAEEKRPSFVDPAPLDVPGIKLVDRLCDHQDRLDQIEKIQQLKNTLELLAMNQRAKQMK